ncbi:hypothetical protein [uncultured Spirosoma sp.]|nr:hypothetical protein [uncultured Spirosoma sp.]
MGRKQDKKYRLSRQLSELIRRHASGSGSVDLLPSFFLEVDALSV